MHTRAARGRVEIRSRRGEPGVRRPQNQTRAATTRLLDYARGSTTPPRTVAGLSRGRKRCPAGDACVVRITSTRSASQLNVCCVRSHARTADAFRLRATVPNYLSPGTAHRSAIKSTHDHRASARCKSAPGSGVRRSNISVLSNPGHPLGGRMLQAADP